MAASNAANHRDQPRHPIRVVSLRTGLSPSVLRAWERRYGVVVPSRSSGGQRLYSDADIERLDLLNRATRAGRSIGRIAGMATEELSALVREDEAALRVEGGSRRPARSGGSRSGPAAVDHETVAEALLAVESLDAERLEAVARRTLVGLGAARFTEWVLAPLLQRIGDRWEEGTLTPAHEHLASAVLRRVIGWMTETVNPDLRARRILITTPSGERHDLGAMMAAATAASEGWRVAFLGPDLPARDIVSAATEMGADAVGLSVVYPRETGRIAREVEEMRRGLPQGVRLFVGGSAAAMLGVVLDRPGVERVDHLSVFRTRLRDLALATVAAP